MELMVLINKIIKFLKIEQEKTKFENIALEWLRYKKISVKESTYYNYMFIIEKYCLEEKSLKSLGIIVCLNTGLRVGEICALKWKNIDLDEKTLFVKKTLQRVYDRKNKISKVIISKPKTECSVRCIPINGKIYSVLKVIKDKYKDEDFFLTGDSNKFIEPRNYQSAFRKILKNSKVKIVNFHVLRHTFATNCIDIGMDIKTLSEIL